MSFQNCFFLVLLTLGFTGNSFSQSSSHLKNLESNSTSSVSKPTYEENAPGTSREEKETSANKIAQEKAEKKLVANTLVYWSLARGQTPKPSLLKDAGISPQSISAFRKRLKVSEKLSPKLLLALRADYDPTNLKLKIKARKRFLNFTTAYQKAMPEFGDLLPEILTVWGEARNLSGFSLSDSLFLQAKMASVIHVLRNRQNFYCRRNKKSLCQKKTPGEIKWMLATKRFQFSAFEPYDRNLAELSLGPASSKSIESIESLPALDQQALVTLARTLYLLDQKKIQLPLPIGNSNIRHYLTPSLLEYSRKTEQELLKVSKSDPRKKLIRVPNSNPKFLASVPTWATSEALIVEPNILVENPESKEWVPQLIPAKDFIYFQGLL